ncbi:unnamed protein product, partial [Protopolystoma xenopodis]
MPGGRQKKIKQCSGVIANRTLANLLTRRRNISDGVSRLIILSFIGLSMLLLSQTAYSNDLQLREPQVLSYHSYRSSPKDWLARLQMSLSQSGNRMSSVSNFLYPFRLKAAALHWKMRSNRFGSPNLTMATFSILPSSNSIVPSRKMKQQSLQRVRRQVDILPYEPFVKHDRSVQLGPIFNEPSLLNSSVITLLEKSRANEEFAENKVDLRQSRADALANGSWVDGRKTTESTGLAMTVLIGTASTFLSLATLVGNILVIVAFFVERDLRTQTNYFIASLAVTDVLIGLCSMNLFTLYLLLEYWPLGEVLCKLWLSLDYTACLTSQYTVFLITVDRYCSVRIPASYRQWRTKRKVLCGVALTWILPACLFFTSIFGWPYFTGSQTSTRASERQTIGPSCYAEFTEDLIFNTVLTLIYFWLTLVVICALYAGIYRVALKLQLKSEARRQRMNQLVPVKCSSSGRSLTISRSDDIEAEDEEEFEEEEGSEEDSKDRIYSFPGSGGCMRNSFSNFRHVRRSPRPRRQRLLCSCLIPETSESKAKRSFKNQQMRPSHIESVVTTCPRKIHGHATDSSISLGVPDKCQDVKWFQAMGRRYCDACYSVSGDTSTGIHEGSWSQKNEQSNHRTSVIGKNMLSALGVVASAKTFLYTPDSYSKPSSSGWAGETSVRVRAKEVAFLARRKEKAVSKRLKKELRMRRVDEVRESLNQAGLPLDAGMYSGPEAGLKSNQLSLYLLQQNSDHNLSQVTSPSGTFPYFSLCKRALPKEKKTPSSDYGHVHGFATDAHLVPSGMTKKNIGNGEYDRSCRLDEFSFIDEECNYLNKDMLARGQATSSNTCIISAYSTMPLTSDSTPSNAFVWTEAVHTALSADSPNYAYSLTAKEAYVSAATNYLNDTAMEIKEVPLKPSEMATFKSIKEQEGGFCGRPSFACFCGCSHVDEGFNSDQMSNINPMSSVNVPSFVIRTHMEVPKWAETTSCCSNTFFDMQDGLSRFTSAGQSTLAILPKSSPDKNETHQISTSLSSLKISQSSRITPPFSPSPQALLKLTNSSAINIFSTSSSKKTSRFRINPRHQQNQEQIQQQFRRSKTENRAFKALRIIGLILGAFVICWTPYHIFILVRGFCKQRLGQTCISDRLYNLAYWLCYLNSP